MNARRETVLRISPEHAEIVVEQIENGIIARKTITSDSLAECLLGSRFDDSVFTSGLLPENCVNVTLSQKFHTYLIRYPDLFADITYYGTVYEHFPLPRLVFRFQWDRESSKVADVRLCVVKDEKLTADTPTFYYPFSNVYGDCRVCTGRNALPVYKNPARIFTLAGFILRMPNNSDMYSASRNRRNLPYRELLEYLKDRDPSVYYTEILVPDHSTFQQFMIRR